MSRSTVRLDVDCVKVGEERINGVGKISHDGFEVLGKLVNNRGAINTSVPVSDYENYFSFLLTLF